MNCCDTSNDMISLDDAMSLLLKTVPISSHIETIPIENSLDRILAVNIQSPINVPSYDNSAMDGYALRYQDLHNSDTLIQIGKSFAGEPFKGSVDTGQCIRIMTGAAVPQGTDTVIMQEHTQMNGDTIHFSSNTKQGANIRRCGEDISREKIILKKGQRISPTHIGLMASVGVAHVTVHKPLRAALFSTGNELRAPDQPLGEACIYDSNRYVIRAMLQRLGVTIIDFGIIPDDPDLLRDTFINAASQCDIVISSGGVSVGEADYTKTILQEVGDVNFWKVAIKPGKPFAFGFISPDQNSSAVFFGLPGNPVSAAITFHQLSIPAIRTMSGEVFTDTPKLHANSVDHLKKRIGRVDFQRGIAEVINGELHVRNARTQSSGALSSLAQSNGYMILEQEQGNVNSGDTVVFQYFDRWI
jgi:molybdopterin molybdotransferase